MSNPEEKYLCPCCETGRRDYELDKRSPFCTYIYCYRNGRCSKFFPMSERFLMSINATKMLLEEE